MIMFKVPGQVNVTMLFSTNAAMLIITFLTSTEKFNQDLNLINQSIKTNRHGMLVNGIHGMYYFIS